MSEIAEAMIKDYRKNIEVKDVKLYRAGCWDTLVVKIIDHNKKHFKNKTLDLDCFYNSNRKLENYVEALIQDYIECKIGRKIKDLEAYHAIQEYKKENRVKDNERTLY